MASTRRPSRLLNLNKSPASNKAISTANATNSPFLRLPPELRSRIYEMALGGNLIRVWYDQTKKFELELCTNARYYQTCESQHLTHKIGSAGPIELAFDYRFKANVAYTCGMLPPCAHLSLHLLGVCRSIYQEAVHIPFAKNNFTNRVSSGSRQINELRAFFTSLIPAQTRAIADIQVRLSAGDMLSRLHLQEPTGLRSLHLKFYFDRFVKHNSPEQLASSVGSMISNNDSDVLGQLSLTTLRLNIAMHGPPSGTYGEDTNPGKWLEVYEKELLEGDNEIYTRMKTLSEKMRK